MNIKFKVKKYLKFFRYYRTQSTEQLDPVFIIGINRSGTSMVSSLCSQHSNLEGLFAGNEEIKVEQKTKHSLGFCESNHIWDWLALDQSFDKQQDDYFLWGHPKHISKYYIQSPRNSFEEKMLLKSIEYFRKTSKRPLIKDQFNALRIPMIKKLFPKAKFILVVREMQDYIPSCFDKWTKDISNKGSYPIGLHWLTFHQTVLYDLNKCAENDYAIFDYSKLFGSKTDLQKEFDDIFRSIGLGEQCLNFENVNSKARFNSNELSGCNLDFPMMTKALDIENCIYK